jgi:RND superfamily putative drug exporter
MSNLASLVSGRRSKFAVLGVWLLVVIGLGPLAGKFESAQKNEPSSFLPEASTTHSAQRSRSAARRSSPRTSRAS